MDLLPQLLGERGGRPHEALFWRMNHTGTRHLAVRAGDSNLIGIPVGGALRESLFGPAEDIGEEHGRIGTGTEQAARPRARWDAWNATNLRPAFVGFGPYHQRKIALYRELDAEAVYREPEERQVPDDR